ncbi:hypothetical protein RJ639_029025 [Escallonia herrerae]|uniref:Ribosomal protein L18 n=1 Tax=Escallonia herrerae TaxID=1293975 RepID=A0AA88X8U4_9ASTE|nr:hypothetical protein RJ639_029025 [Escallonia herrerae]
MFLSRGIPFTRLANYQFLSRACTYSLLAGSDSETTQFPDVNRVTSASNDSNLHLSPLLSNPKANKKDYDIELVDDETWWISTGLAEAWRGNATPTAGVADEVGNYLPPNKVDPDFDEIEDMRIRGNLFYKIDRSSKEFEEYSFDFHRRKGDQRESRKKENPKVEKCLKKGDERKEGNVKGGLISNPISRGGRHVEIDEKHNMDRRVYELDGGCVEKKVRTPTFNQVTAPYHEPFCLDIYISKASVRACIVHRATSNVVAVAHSISKDMKFDLGSTKNAAACAAVGEVLAQRALADDIHNVVYTPRKGEKLEGKLQLVLQSIIKSGVDVKVKLKQRKFKQGVLLPTYKKFGPGYPGGRNLNDKAKMIPDR